MVEISVDEITIDPENANIHTEDDLISRKRSIKNIGLQYPIKVVLHNGKYQIVDGESRFIACRELGWTKIPCEILNINPDDKEEVARYSFALNKERQMYPFAECRHIARLYRAKREKDPRKTTALREEIAKEFGYSEKTIQDMIAIGEISIPYRFGMETFGLKALKALLPLRIGRVNPNTGEDENDYTLVHKCIEWLHDNNRIPPSVADVNEFKDLVSDEMKELVVKHKAVMQAQKELEKERRKHEEELQKMRANLEATLTQTHALEIAQKESEIKRLQLQLETQSEDKTQINNAITELQKEYQNLLQSIDTEIEKRLEIEKSAWEFERENNFRDRLNTAEAEYQEKMNTLELALSQKNLQIERLQQELKTKEAIIEEKEKLISRTRTTLCIKKYVDSAVIHCGKIAFNSAGAWVISRRIWIISRRVATDHFSD